MSTDKPAAASKPRSPEQTSGKRSSMPKSPTETLQPARGPSRPKTRRPKRPPSRRLTGLARLVSGVFTLLLAGMVVAGGATLWLYHEFERAGPLAVSRTIGVPRGEGPIEISARLEREGIISNRWAFVASHYVRNVLSGGRATVLKAGEYEIRKAASMSAVHATLVEGKSILYKVTLPEGLTSAQIVERLMAEDSLTGEIAEVPPEGSLLPDTYRFSKGMSRQELIERMQAEQQKFLAQMWEKRQADLPVSTPEQALILASIVEKETGRADERHRVAGVFVNRLRKGMRLQSDPTITYGIVGGKGSLGRSITRSDIDGKTPYNTYQISGLPPGPICNPGRPAIEATLDPAATSDLFFVADGTGGHAFSETLKEHNAAVANWRKVEKQTRDDARDDDTEAAAPASAAAAIPLPPAPGATRAVSRPAPPPAGIENTVEKSPSQPAPLPTVTHLNAVGANAVKAAKADASAAALGVPIPTRKPKR